MNDVVALKMQSAPLSIVASNYNSTSSTASFKSTQRQLTVMLVTICCTAVCLQLPYTVLYLLNADKYLLWPDEHDHLTLHAKIYLSMKVADVFATANYAVNFVLYCVSGSVFRQGVRRLCRPARRRLRRRGGRYDAADATTRALTNRTATNEPARTATTVRLEELKRAQQ